MRLSRLLALVVPLVLLAPAPARADVNSELQLLLLLNGTPSKVGTLVSAGASVSNSSTATPFTIEKGAVYLIWCDAAVNFTASGGTASTTATNAAAGAPLDTKEKLYWRAASTAISAAGTAAFNCPVYRML